MRGCMPHYAREISALVKQGARDYFTDAFWSFCLASADPPRPVRVISTSRPFFEFTKKSSICLTTIGSTQFLRWSRQED